MAHDSEGVEPDGVVKSECEGVVKSECEGVVKSESDGEDETVQIVSALSKFDKRLISPRLTWFNARPERAQSLLRSLTPTKSGAAPLRIVDHMVSKYSRESSIMIPGENGVPVELWNFYRRTLSSVGKNYFDVFKRRHAVKLTVCGTPISTTVGQVVFFQWFHQYELDRVLSQNLDDVKEHMKRAEAVLKHRKAVSDTKTRTRSRPDVVKPLAMIHSGTFSLDFT
jgi:hypothetical protein